MGQKALLGQNKRGRVSGRRKTLAASAPLCYLKWPVSISVPPPTPRCVACGRAAVAFILFCFSSGHCQNQIVPLPVPSTRTGDRWCGQKSPGLGMESGDLDLNLSLNLMEGVSLARACPPGCGVRALTSQLSRCPLLLSTPGNWPPGIAVTLISVGEQRKGCSLGCQVMSVVLFLADKMMPEGVFLQYLALL